MVKQFIARKGLEFLGKGRELLKRQKAKIPQEKVQSAQEKLSKATDFTKRAGKKTAKTTKDLFTVPKTGPFTVQRRARDRAYDALVGPLGVSAAPLTAFDAYQELTDDEPLTAGKAALLLGGALGAPFGFREGIRAGRRLITPISRGYRKKTAFSPNPKRDKEDMMGQKVASGIKREPRTLGMGKPDTPVEKLSDRMALASLVPFGGAAGLAIKDAITGPAELAAPEEMPKLDLTDTEKKFGSLVEEQMGPNEKAAMEEIQRRQGTDAAYKQGQIDAILSTAQQQDKALQEKQTQIITPGEAAQGETAETTGDGGQPPGVANNTDLNFIGPPEKPEISVDKNPETAVQDADNSATTVLQSGNNPTGSREPATIESRFPTISLDIGGAKLRAQFMEKDFKGTQEAMKKYEDYIQDKRDKRQTFDQYQEKYKDLLGGGYEDEKNIAMFKWAMAMMTGRSNEQGLNGFLDIAGQAGMIYADDVQAIAAQERADRQAIAASFMQYDQDLDKFLDAADIEMMNKNIALAEQMANEKVDSQTRYIDQVLKIAQAQAVIKDLEEKAMDNKAIKGAREIGYVYDENAYEKKRIVQIGTDAKTGERVEIINTPNGEEFRPITSKVTTIGKPLPPARVAKVMSQLTALDQGVEYAEIVANSVLKVGSVGFYDSMVSNLSALLDDWGNSVGILNEGTNYPGGVTVIDDEVNAKIDNSVRTMLINNAGYKGYLEGTQIDLKKQRESANELLRKYDKDQAKAVNDAKAIIEDARNGKVNDLIPDAIKTHVQGLSATEKQAYLFKMAQLRLIENRMKYIVANADKGEDRLTVADVVNAEKSTKIFGWTLSEQRVKNNYRALKGALDARASKLAQTFVLQGGDQNLLDILGNLKYVKEHKQRTGQKQDETINQTPSRDLFGILNVDLGAAQ